MASTCAFVKNKPTPLASLFLWKTLLNPKSLCPFFFRLIPDPLSLNSSCTIPSFILDCTKISGALPSALYFRELLTKLRKILSIVPNGWGFGKIICDACFCFYNFSCQHFFCPEQYLVKMDFLQGLLCIFFDQQRFHQSIQCPCQMFGYGLYFVNKHFFRPGISFCFVNVQQCI